MRRTLVLANCTVGEVFMASVQNMTSKTTANMVPVDFFRAVKGLFENGLARQRPPGFKVNHIVARTGYSLRFL